MRKGGLGIGQRAHANGPVKSNRLDGGSATLLTIEEREEFILNSNRGPVEDRTPVPFAAKPPPEDLQGSLSRTRVASVAWQTAVPTSSASSMTPQRTSVCLNFRMAFESMTRTDLFSSFRMVVVGAQM